MAFDPEFLELMPLSCTLTPPAAHTIDGLPVAGTPAQSVRCHVQHAIQHIVREGMVSETETGVVFLAGVYNVTPEWKLEIPTPGGTAEVRIISVDQNTDEEGYHHTAVHFGSF